MRRTVNAKIDAMVHESSPTRNFDDTRKLTLNGDGAAEKRAFIYFRAPFDRGSDVNVTEAILRFWLKGAWAGGPHTVTIERVSESWRERTITWDDQPAVAGAAVTVAVTGGTDGQKVEVDIASILTAFASGSPMFGIRLTLDTVGDKSIHSTETAATKIVDDEELVIAPELEVEWNRAPGVPTDLKPAGGRAVSSTTPPFSWNYHSALGEDSQDAFQLQIDTTADLLTPVHDTGTVVSVEQRYRLAGFAVAAATTYYWRVKTRDESGRWSEWSDVASFIYEPKGALTIVSPAADPNDFVEDLTPSIEWTFASQDAFAVWLYRYEDDGNLTLIWKSGKQAGADQSVTVPKGHITNEADTYRVRVRTWDNVDREGDVDKDYQEASRDFTYVRSEVPAGVTDFAAVVEGPAIVMTWNRVATPDYFSISVDDEVVEARVEPEDIRVDADSFEYRLYRARPGGQRKVAVEAVVNSGGSRQHSAPAEATLQFDVVGIWIIHEESETEVCVIGDAPSMAIGESSEKTRLIGARAPVKITDSVGGYEGEVRGIVADFLGVDAKTWRNRFLNIIGKADRGSTRLIFLDYNFPAFLEAEPVVQPASELIEAYEIEVGFSQTGDFTFRSVA